MKKKFSSILSVLLVAVMLLSTGVTSFAATTAGKLADGDYTVNVETDANGIGKMFYIARVDKDDQDKNICKLTVKDGQMIATIRLNGQGYDKLYLGTAEEAAAADSAAYINFVEDEEGYYTFEVPVSAFDTEFAVAAYGTKGAAWHDHTLTFSYNTPTKTSLKSVKGARKAITVKWYKKTSNNTGYQIQYSTSSTFKNAKKIRITSSTTTSRTIKNLKAGKKYYVRIRAYKQVGEKYYYSSWSAKKSVKTS